MSQVTKYFCDTCGAELVDRKMGLVVTIGFSAGGWGHRDNLVDFSGEVCQGCYKYLGAEMAEVWLKRKLAIQRKIRVAIPEATALPKLSWWERLKTGLKCRF